MKKNIFALILLLAAAVFSASAQQTENQSAAERIKIDADQNYLILSTKRIQTMEKELEEVAAKGFRVLYGAPTVSYDMALFLDRVENPEKSFSYKILATSRNKTMEKELNEHAAKGFRLLPRTIIFKQGLLTAELVTVMERETNANVAYEYKLVEARKEVKLHSKIDAARAEGFNPVTMITLGLNVVVMEKITETK
jgi:hypothetical protein